MLFRSVLAYLYEQGVFPNSYTDADTGATVNIDEPWLDVRDGATEDPALVLRLTGTLSNNGADAEFEYEFDLAPFARSIANQAPVAALQLRPMPDAPPDPLRERLEASVGNVLSQFDIPIFDPLIGLLEASHFPEGNPPSRDEWTAEFYLGRVGNLEHRDILFRAGRPDIPEIRQTTMLQTVPALMATLALPGESAILPGRASIVPRATGIQILLSRPAMDALLQAQADARVGTRVQGATIQRNRMLMHDLGIEIRGRARHSEKATTIDWDGVLLIMFRKRFVHRIDGRIGWHDGFVSVFASGIDVDVDYDWWVDLLRGLSGSLLWAFHLIMEKEAFRKAEEAPDVVRSAFRDQVSGSLRAMMAAAAGLSNLDAAPFLTFGHDAWVLEGHYTMSLIAFAGLTKTEIVEVQHDVFDVEGAEGQSVGLLKIGTGHLLHPEEAGRLMKADLLRIPGHHGVEAEYGFYVRSNPNETGDDNLVDPNLIHEK